MSSETPEKPWRFVTNHTQVLLAIARNPEIRTRDIADAVGITERAAQRIVADLAEAGYVETTRVGRRNHYIADAVGITERAAQRIVADLAEAGYVETTRVGRRNHYTVNGEVSMRHPAQHNHEIGALLGAGVECTYVHATEER
jgi:DNA-binding MarR family transcriptional regulator